MSKKPILGITMGDPASIGPEITVKALSDPAIYEKCSPIIIGDAAVMEAAVGIVGKDVKINAVSDVKEAKFEFGTIDVYDMKLVDMETGARCCFCYGRQCSFPVCKESH